MRSKLMRSMCATALLFSPAFFLLGCGGGGSTATKSSVPPPPVIVSPGAIPPSFFAITDTGTSSAPAVNFGTLGHPQNGGWSAMEQTSPTPDFTFVDAYVNLAPQDSDGSNTADVILSLSRTPPWALADQSSCAVDPDSGLIGCTAPPDNISDWVAFVTALIQHYNGSTAPHIKYYEIWNEADMTNWFSGSPAQLEALAAAAFPIIKQDGHSMVIAPSMVGDAQSTSGAAAVFLAQYLQAGGSQFADIAAFHGYIAPKATPAASYPLPTVTCANPCGGAITTQMSTYRQVLDTNGMQGKPLFNTEGGYYSADVINSDTAAAWLGEYYALQAGGYQTLNVQVVNWWLWGGQGTVGSLVGSEVGTAYNQMYTWLVGAFTSPCSNTGSIWTCNITRSGGYQGQIIWDSSQSCSSGCTTSSQSVSSTFTNYHDLAGSTTAISGSVPVGLKPILLD